MVAVEKNYVENSHFSFCANTFLSTKKMGKSITFTQGMWKKER